jgi:DNA-binding CsgD family transcriptional regulator
MHRRQNPAIETPSVIALPMRPDEWERIAQDLQFSPREAEIARLILQAMGDKEIAAALSVSLSTVRTHLRHIFLRLGIVGRVELVLRIVAAHSKRTSSDSHRQKLILQILPLNIIVVPHLRY